MHRKAAILGWDPNYESDGQGRRFRDKVQQGDIILIARGKNQVDMIGFGQVMGEFERRPLAGWGIGDAISMRKLSPFKVKMQAPKSIQEPLLATLQHTKGFVQKRPERNADVEKVFRWIERQLELEDQHGHRVAIIEKGTRKSKIRRYKVTTLKQVIEARRREAALQDDYEQWLLNHDRHLSTLRYGRMECDAWEDERKNLIEAKASVSREDIRMAVGELLHYAFLGHEICNRPNLAVLLPKYPGDDHVKWLESIDVKIIWCKGQAFVDNANGQFT
jgi:hypothetical protein